MYSYSVFTTWSTHRSLVTLYMETNFWFSECLVACSTNSDLMSIGTIGRNWCFRVNTLNALICHLLVHCVFCFYRKILFLSFFTCNFKMDFCVFNKLKESLGSWKGWCYQAKHFRIIHSMLQISFTRFPPLSFVELNEHVFCISQ